MKNKVLAKLKPKALALGFNEKELEGVADKMVGNLTDDADDATIDAEIDKVIPYLQVSQSMANRVINAAKPKPSKEKTDEGVDENKPKADDEPSWFKAYREQQDAKIAALTRKSETEDRRKLFEADLNGLLPKQREAMLKDFERINFSDDADFEAYRTEKQGIVGEIVQELANKGLKDMGKPGSGDSEKTEENDFIKTLAEMNTPTT